MMPFSHQKKVRASKKRISLRKSDLAHLFINLSIWWIKIFHGCHFTWTGDSIHNDYVWWQRLLLSVGLFLILAQVEAQVTILQNSFLCTILNITSAPPSNPIFIQMIPWSDLAEKSEICLYDGDDCCWVTLNNLSTFNALWTIESEFEKECWLVNNRLFGWEAIKYTTLLNHKTRRVCVTRWKWKFSCHFSKCKLFSARSSPPGSC